MASPADCTVLVECGGGQGEQNHCRGAHADGDYQQKRVGGRGHAEGDETREQSSHYLRPGDEHRGGDGPDEDPRVAELAAP